MVGGLFYNNLVAENPAVAAFGKMPFGQGAGVLGHNTQMPRVEFEITDGIGTDKAPTVSEIGIELFGMSQFPRGAVAGGIDLYRLWGENPVVGIVEEAHGDGLDRCAAAEV